MPRLCLVLAILAASQLRSWALVDPWYYHADMIRAGLKFDPDVADIEFLERSIDDQNYLLINIKLEEGKQAKAEALATLLGPFGNKKYGPTMQTKTQVYTGETLVDPRRFPRKPKTTFATAKIALERNPLFVEGVYIPPGQLNAEHWFLVFAPKVVQFHSDDIGDLYLNTNLVAEELFYQVLTLGKTLMLTVSTAQCPETGC